MSAHGHTTPATLASHDDHGQQGGMDLQAMIKTYGWPFVIGVVVLILSFWVRSIALESISESAANHQALITAQERLPKTCGEYGEPVCECRGKRQVARYIEPGESAEFLVTRPITTYPRPSPDILKQTDPVTGYSSTDEQEYMRLKGSTSVYTNLSKKTIPLRCQYS